MRDTGAVVKGFVVIGDTEMLCPVGMVKDIPVGTVTVELGSIVNVDGDGMNLLKVGLDMVGETDSTGVECGKTMVNCLLRDCSCVWLKSLWTKVGSMAWGCSR